MSTQETPELSRIVSLDKVSPTSQLTYVVNATDKEQKDLANRFGVISIDSMNATFTISQADDLGCYYIDGKLNAHVIQSCVLTLENVPESVQMPIHIVLKPESLKTLYKEDAFVHAEEDDVDFVRPDGTIDLGEISAQYLALGLNPYPRSTTTLKESLEISSEETPTSPKNPFAALKKLKK